MSLSVWCISEWYPHGSSMLLQIARFHSFLWLNDNLSICHMSHFLYPFRQWTLGLCHVSVIVNNTLMNMEVQTSLQINVCFLQMHNQKWNCWILVVLILFFWGSSTLFSIVVASIYIPNNSAQGFPLLYLLYYFCPTFVIFCPLD